MHLHLSPPLLGLTRRPCGLPFRKVSMCTLVHPSNSEVALVEEVTPDKDWEDPASGIRSSSRLTPAVRLRRSGGTPSVSGLVGDGSP